MHHVTEVCLPSQSTAKMHNHQEKKSTPREFFKIVSSMFDNHIILPFQTFHMFLLRDLCFMHCSLDFDVLRAQRIMGFFILITHKSTKSENLITWKYRYFCFFMFICSAVCIAFPSIMDYRRNPLFECKPLTTLLWIDAISVTTNLLNNPFPSESSIVFSSQKPFYSQPDYSAW